MRISTMFRQRSAWALLALILALALPAASQAQGPGGLGGLGGGGGKGDASGDPLGGLGTIGADQTRSEAERIRIDAVALRPTLNPGGEAAIAVRMLTTPGWKVWPGKGQDVLRPDIDEFAIRTQIAIGTPGDGPSAPGDLSTSRPEWIEAVGRVQWPEPSAVPNPLDAGQTETFGFKGEAVAYVPLILAADAPLGVTSLPVSILFQACDESTCLQPETRTVEVPVEIVEPGETGSIEGIPPGQRAERFAGFDDSVYAALREGEPRVIELDAFGLTLRLDASGALGLGLLFAVAALGGLLLNFTPCVLPVIPLKVMGLANSAKNPARTLALGTVMSAGVVFFWLVLGGLIATVSGFDAISSLFQMPAFTIGVGVFIAAMAIGMLGVFTVQLPKAAYLVNPSHETVPGSFVFGIMTAILSTPCTAPFMGGAAAWAAAQENKGIVLATFAAIGAGMALPYFVLSLNPKWVSKLPKSGPASEVVKQVMGLLMLAVAAFFAGTGLSGLFTEAPDPPSKAYWWAVAAFAAAAGVFLIARTFRISKRTGPRAVFTVVGLAIAGAGVGSAVSFTADGPVDWTYYTPERLDEAAERGDVIVVDFTAEWCLNCKALEKAVLYRDRVASILNAPGVTAMKVDLTGNNPRGQALLKEMDAVAIPLLVVLEPDAQGGTRLVFRSDAYTAEQVLNAIETAGGPATNTGRVASDDRSRRP